MSSTFTSASSGADAYIFCIRFGRPGYTALNAYLRAWKRAWKLPTHENLILPSALTAWFTVMKAPTSCSGCLSDATFHSRSCVTLRDRLLDERTFSGRNGTDGCTAGCNSFRTTNAVGLGGGKAYAQHKSPGWWLYAAREHPPDIGPHPASLWSLDF
jgi:hypothetical protein